MRVFALRPSRPCAGRVYQPATLPERRSVRSERVARQAAWSYPNPAARYAVLRDCIAIYPGRVDTCLVDGERALPQEGGFYGGWITNEVAGPFKGGPGTQSG